jgi:signal transduction histidine kinase
VAVLNDITQLKELDRLKSEMVRWASHDLKNPLTAAMLYIDLLKEELAVHGNADVEHSLVTIEKQLERMNRIIRGILDLERLKTMTTANELCHPTKIIQNAIDEMRELAVDRQICLEVSIDSDVPDFLGDSQQFERALINLIENAIKFTPAGKHTVWIAARSKGDQIIFQVKDEGIGIPETLQDQVFDRFFRGQQKGQVGAEHVSGSGLGLSLVKTIVENHHGKVWLESRVGAGTTFYVALPQASEGMLLE